MLAAILLLLVPELCSAAVREVCSDGRRVNVRSGPSLHAPIRKALTPGTDVRVLGRSSDGHWLKIAGGWIYRSLTCGVREGVAKQRWRNPVSGGACLTSDFGPRPRPCAGCSSFHRGCDFGAGCGRTVVPAAPGKVVFAGWGGAGGKMVIVRHILPSGARVFSVYAHLSVIQARAGQQMGAKSVIGKVGSTGMSTGCHLHFEMRAGSRNGRVFDPQRLIGAGRCPKGGVVSSGSTPAR